MGKGRSQFTPISNSCSIWNPNSNIHYVLCKAIYTLYLNPFSSLSRSPTDVPEHAHTVQKTLPKGDAQRPPPRPQPPVQPSRHPATRRQRPRRHPPPTTTRRPLHRPRPSPSHPLLPRRPPSPQPPAGAPAASLVNRPRRKPGIRSPAAAFGHPTQFKHVGRCPLPLRARVRALFICSLRWREH